MEEEPRKLRKEPTSLFAAKFRSKLDGRFTATERRGYRVAVIRHLDNFATDNYRTAWSGFAIPVSMLTRFASSTESVPASGTVPRRFAA